MAVSISGRGNGHPARILNFLMIAEHARELRPRCECLDGASYSHGIHLARVHRIADINEPSGKRLRDVIGGAGPRNQKATVAMVDYRFQLRQMHGDDRSEERRVGKECAITCRSRWSPYH